MSVSRNNLQTTFRMVKVRALTFGRLDDELSLKSHFDSVPVSMFMPTYAA